MEKEMVGMVEKQIDNKTKTKQTPRPNKPTTHLVCLVAFAAAHRAVARKGPTLTGLLTGAHAPGTLHLGAVAHGHKMVEGASTRFFWHHRTNPLGLFGGNLPVAHLVLVSSFQLIVLGDEPAVQLGRKVNVTVTAVRTDAVLGVLGKSSLFQKLAIPVLGGKNHLDVLLVLDGQLKELVSDGRNNLVGVLEAINSHVGFSTGSCLSRVLPLLCGV